MRTASSQRPRRTRTQLRHCFAIETFVYWHSIQVARSANEPRADPIVGKPTILGRDTRRKSSRFPGSTGAKLLLMAELLKLNAKSENASLFSDTQLISTQRGLATIHLSCRGTPRIVWWRVNSGYSHRAKVESGGTKAGRKLFGIPWSFLCKCERSFSGRARTRDEVDHQGDKGQNQQQMDKASGDVEYGDSAQPGNQQNDE